MYCMPFLTEPNFSSLVESNKTAHYETDYIILFNNIVEACSSSFSLRFEFSR